MNYVFERINRYMLGCKQKRDIPEGISSAELIDTCWDVNILALCFAGTCVFELIDTCWDVNLFHAFFCSAAKMELIDTCWDVNASIMYSTSL